MDRQLKRKGILFVIIGPTGSGKTTTLYAILSDINDPGTKIITVEDPVEYMLAGINQVQVHEHIGFTFASALRSMLRQSPNVIMLGEIRDMETATIFAAGFANSIPSGALLLVSDQPMVPEGVKTEASDRKVTENFVERHITIGIEALKLIRRHGKSVKHLRFD